jgi:hypothetical protein
LQQTASVVEAAEISARQEAVLAKAVARAAGHLGLPNTVLARVIGLSEASVSRLRHGRYRLQRGTKPFELAQLLVRLFRGLDAITGGDDDASRSWLASECRVLAGCPLELIQTVPGLMAVIAYVDSRRAVV